MLGWESCGIVEKLEEHWWTTVSKKKKKKTTNSSCDSNTWLLHWLTVTHGKSIIAENEGIMWHYSSLCPFICTQGNRSTKPQNSNLFKKNCISIKKYFPHCYCCCLFPMSCRIPFFATGFSVQAHQAWMCKHCLLKTTRGTRAVPEYGNFFWSIAFATGEYTQPLSESDLFGGW